MLRLFREATCALLTSSSPMATESGLGARLLASDKWSCEQTQSEALKIQILLTQNDGNISEIPKRERSQLITLVICCCC